MLTCFLLACFLLPFAQLSETLSKFLSAQVTVETDRVRGALETYTSRLGTWWETRKIRLPCSALEPAIAINRKASPDYKESGCTWLPQAVIRFTS